MSMPVDSTSRAFEDFYRSRAPGLYRYASVVAGPGRAEDACQDAWLRMWRAWDSASDDHRDAWARQVVRNCCFSNRMSSDQTTEWDFDTPALDLPPDELVVRRSEAAEVGDCIRRLPAHLRDVMWMREVLGFTYAEMAAALGIPMGTVMSRLHAARRKLTRRLAG